MYDVTTAKLFLLDMDGTFYLDDTLLPGALEFLALCRATGRQFAFLTNNSSKSKADYLAKLTRLGADVTEHDIFTSENAAYSVTPCRISANSASASRNASYARPNFS